MGRLRVAVATTLLVVAALPFHASADEEPGKAWLQPPPKNRTVASVLRRRGTVARSARLAPLRDARSGSPGFMHFHMEFENERYANQFGHPRIQVISRAGPCVEMLVRESDLAADDDLPTDLDLYILGAPGLVAWQPDYKVEPPPPPIGLADEAVVRGAPEKVVRGGFRDARGLLTGHGVAVAIVDDGLDFRHPDFRNVDPNDPEDRSKWSSRLLYLWDMTTRVRITPRMRRLGVREGPIRYPDGTPVGTLYTRKALTSALRKQLGKRLPETHAGVHGTCCAGIAAGNGNAWKAWWDAEKSLGKDMSNWGPRTWHDGVAPEADLIGVKIAGKGGGWSHVGFVPAICRWLDEAAGDKPLVVSCSFGWHTAGHDGTQVLERHLDRLFPLDRSGRAICIAAGNERNARLHTDFSLSRAGAKITWNVPDDTLLDWIQINVYVDGGLKHENLLVEPQRGTGDIWYTVWRPNHVTGHGSFTMETRARTGTVLLKTRSGGPLRADAYLLPEGEGLAFARPTQRNLILSPACSTNAITVGSYDWNAYVDCTSGVYTMDNVDNMGRLSAYSNPGPRRDRFLKPEIVAPGQWYQSPLPVSLSRRTPVCKRSHMWRGPVRAYPVDVSGSYVLMNGTSAATPYTAGIIALMFQRDPSLTLGRVRALFKKHANKFPMQQEGKEASWGGGRLDVPAVTRIFRDING